MMTQDIVEKQRLEATQQLSSASTMQEKILTDQYEAQVKMLDAEADRQIELTKQTSAADAPGLVVRKDFDIFKISILVDCY